jgi:hypothetical protein
VLQSLSFRPPIWAAIGSFDSAEEQQFCQFPLRSVDLADLTHMLGFSICKGLFEESGSANLREQTRIRIGETALVRLLIRGHSRRFADNSVLHSFATIGET